MSLYPALQIAGVDHELALAAVDDAGPVAAEDGNSLLTVFFPTTDHRARARAALVLAFPAVTLIDRDVDDEDWARRSQEGLGPIVVGRLTVSPARHTEDPLEIVIIPSMGFGTGHHATTRLCLAAMQQIELSGRSILDVGTGSGVLALAARALGAENCLGVDHDADAIESARQNLDLNPKLTRGGAVRFAQLDLTRDPLPQAELVTANLTGTSLQRSAATLVESLAPGGDLIVSGILAGERDDVVAAFSALCLVSEAAEDEWVGLCFNRPIHDKV